MTTLEVVQKVMKHDDLPSSYKPWFVRGVLERTLHNVYFPLIGCPTIKVEFASADPEVMKFMVFTALRSQWSDTSEFDASIFNAENQQPFADAVDAFCKEVAARLEAKKQSGEPWWSTGDERSSSFHMQLPRSKEQGGYTDIHTKIGAVRLRGGRWCWWTYPSDYRPEWKHVKLQEGKKATKEEAMAMVAGHWNKGVA